MDDLRYITGPLVGPFLYFNVSPRDSVKIKLNISKHYNWQLTFIVKFLDHYSILIN